MDWDQYYEKFYDWTTSTQISRMSSLTSYGASSEVAEVAQEYMTKRLHPVSSKKQWRMEFSLRRKRFMTYPVAATQKL